MTLSSQSSNAIVSKCKYRSGDQEIDTVATVTKVMAANEKEEVLLSNSNSGSEDKIATEIVVEESNNDVNSDLQEELKNFFEHAKTGEQKVMPK